MGVACPCNLGLYERVWLALPCHLRYFLLPDALFDFVKALAKREASLQSVPGYLGISLQQVGPQVIGMESGTGKQTT
eukprot:scaffold73196_cov14-Tisochrysis_lutea.AAC.2